MNAPVTNTEVAIFQAPRLPYHEAINERFGVDRASWKALVEAIYPSAKTADSVVMALSYCRARNLDPFKRPVHIVPMWDSKRGGYVETVWPGIAELRTTAFRTKQYAGCDEGEFGQTIKRDFSGRIKGKEGWSEKTVTVEFPEWCRMTVYRELGGRVCRFVGPKVKWIEAYATIGNSELPNDMWQSRPEGQLEKCAEAAALRKSFPEELGNELTAEEMAGRSLPSEVREVGTVRNDGPPAPSTLKAVEHHQQIPEATPGEAVLVPGETLDPETGEVTWSEPPTSGDDQDASAEKIDEASWIKDLQGAFDGCEDLGSFSTKQRQVMAPMKSKVSVGAWAMAQRLSEDTFKRIQGND